MLTIDMSKLINLYGKFRTKGGMDARAALRAAKILNRWQELECGEHDEPQIGSVRLVAEEERENYFDVFGEPEGYTNINGKRVSAEQARKELEELLERTSNWGIRSEYFDGEDWQIADSIGQCAGYENVLSPFENWYVVDLMDSALDHAANLEPEYAI